MGCKRRAMDHVERTNAIKTLALIRWQNSKEVRFCFQELPWAAVRPASTLHVNQTEELSMWYCWGISETIAASANISNTSGLHIVWPFLTSAPLRHLSFGINTETYCMFDKITSTKDPFISFSGISTTFYALHQAWKRQAHTLPRVYQVWNIGHMKTTTHVYWTTPNFQRSVIFPNYLQEGFFERTM